MAYYIELDSATRNRHMYANPHKYQVEPGQVKTWSQSTFGTQDTERMSVRVVNVIIPYVAALKSEPRLYLDVHSVNRDDLFKVNCMDGNHRRAKFVLIQDKIQDNSAGSPAWMHFKTGDMAQVLRIQRGGPLAIEIFDRDGTTVSGNDTADPDEAIDETKQTYILLAMEPFSNVPTRVDTY